MATPTHPSPPLHGEEEDGFWTAFVREINWTEPLMLGLAAFHLSTLALVILTRKEVKLQASIAVILGMLVFAAQYLNEYAAIHWREIATQQYFDSSGMFITMVFSLPMVINALVIAVAMVTHAGSLLITVKRAQLRELRKNQGSKAAGNGKNSVVQSTSAASSKHTKSE